MFIYSDPVVNVIKMSKTGDMCILSTIHDPDSADLFIMSSPIDNYILTLVLIIAEILRIYKVKYEKAKRER